MEKPVCYIPEQLRNYYKLQNAEKDAFVNKQNAIKTILSIYMDYQCLPNEMNDYEPHDPNGLGIFEMICLKLLMMPKHTRLIRTVYSQIPEIYNRIIEKKQNIMQVMDDTFSLDQLEDFGL